KLAGELRGARAAEPASDGAADRKLRYETAVEHAVVGGARENEVAACDLGLAPRAEARVCGLRRASPEGLEVGVELAIESDVAGDLFLLAAHERSKHLGVLLDAGARAGGRGVAVEEIPEARVAVEAFVEALEETQAPPQRVVCEAAREGGIVSRVVSDDAAI